MGKDSVTLGADVVGPKAHEATESSIMLLRKLLAKHCVGHYSKDIDEFAFVLRIDGKVCSWNFKRCERLRLNRRSRYITVDIGVPQKRWGTNDGVGLARYLLDCVAEGLRLMVGKLQRSKLDI